MKRVIIAPYSMHRDILIELRKDKVFSPIKVYTKEDLVRRVFGEFSFESRIYLMQRDNITYSLSDEQIRFLPFIYKKDGEVYCDKINRLLEVKEELISQNHYQRDNLINVAFKDASIEIYGYSKFDTVLNEILRRLNCPYTYIENNKDVPDMEVYNFEKVEDEVLYVLNKICLLASDKDNPVKLEDIYLYNVDETYSYYLSLYMDSFNLKINGLYSTPLYLSGYCTEFLKLYDQNHDVISSLNELEQKVGKDFGEDYQYIEFNDVVMSVYFENTPYDIQRDIIVSTLKVRSLKSIHYKNAVNVIKEPIRGENKYIFIMNFALGIVPKVYKDDEYLSNKEKKQTSILTSVIKNKIEKDLILQFLNTNNHFYYSLASQSISNQYYPSSLVKNPKAQLKHINLDNVGFSQKMFDYLYAQKIDLNIKYKEISYDYLRLKDVSNIDKIRGSYDNSFTGVNAIDKNATMTHSFSSIDTYYNCPFKYYLSKVLKFEKYESSFHGAVGNVAHSAFEGIHNANYDFERNYLKGYLKEEKNYNFSPLQLLMFDAIKLQIKRTANFILEYQNSNKPLKALYESKHCLAFKGNDKVKLEGKIDKILKLDLEHYIIVDYKSSEHTFDPFKLFFGLNLQLPLYYALLRDDIDFKNLKLGGVYYQQFMNKKDNVYLDPNLNTYSDYHKHVGVTIEGNISPIELDKSILDKSKFFKGVSIKDGKAIYTPLMNQQQFDKLIDVALNKVLEADNRIRNNDFPIYTYENGQQDSGCGFCNYRDICYLRRNDSKQVYNLANELKILKEQLNQQKSETKEEEEVIEA